MPPKPSKTLPTVLLRPLQRLAKALSLVAFSIMAGSFGFLCKSDGILHSARHNVGERARVAPTRRQRKIPVVRF